MKKKKPKPIIYLLHDTTNGMEYVGQTTQTLDARFRQHCNNKRHDMYIDNMIRAHGAENFDRYVLVECATQDELNVWEPFFIILLDTKAPNGYNLKDGGDGGGHHSQETCAQMSESRRGENNPAYNKTSSRRKSPYKNLLAAMAERGINTYRELAEIMGLSASKLSHKLNGETYFTDDEKAFLADYFGKPAEYLFARDDGKSSESNRGNPAQNRGHCPYPKILEAMAKCKIRTYGQLAERAGVSPKNFERKMNGIRNFTNKDKIKISKALGEPLEYLFVRDDGIGVVSDCGRYPYQNLEAEMAIQKISRRMLAKLLDMPFSTLSDRIHGRGEFTDEQKARLVVILGKPAEYLFARTTVVSTCADESSEQTFTHQKVYRNLLAEITAHEITPVMLAGILNVTKKTLYSKLRGEINFSAEQKAKLVEILGKPIEYLFARDDAE